MSSSYYSTAELEAMRKEQIRQDLLQSVAAIRQQLSVTVGSAPAAAVTAYHTTISISESDEIVSAFKDVRTTAFRGEKLILETLDFSSLLESVPLRENAIHTRISKAVARIDDRAILSRLDMEANDKLISSINDLLRDKGLDSEHTAAMVEMRVNAYLASGRTMTAELKEQIDAQRAEYRALCDMCGAREEEVPPDEMDKAIRKMTATLLKEREDAYIAEVIENAMSKLGFHTLHNCTLSGSPGMLYAVDGTPLCDVFVSNDGSDFLFETVAKGRGTLNQRRQTEENALTICSKYEQLAEEATLHGVKLRCVVSAEPKYENIASEAEIVKTQKERGSHRERGKSQKKKREMHMGG